MRGTWRDRRRATTPGECGANAPTFFARVAAATGSKRRVLLAATASVAVTSALAAGCAAPPVQPLTAPAGSGVSSLPGVTDGPSDPAATPWLRPSRSATPTPSTPPTTPGSGTGGPAAPPPIESGPVTVSSAAFGMHVEQTAGSAWPDIAVGAFRIWNADSTWGSLERSPGAWSFGALDGRVANAAARGAPVLLVLSHPPTWAASRPDLQGYGGSPSPPRDINAWRAYVRTVAQRYAGRIEAYEIWNEPNLPQFFVGSPGQLAELTIAAAQEINAVDAAAKVVSAGVSARTSGAQSYFSAYLGALPSSAIDVVGIHVYPYPGDGPESMLGMVADFRGLARAAGHGAKPMWNTEIGYGRTPDSVFTGDTAAALILRTYLVLPAYGLPRNYWYKWDDRSFVGLYLVNSDRQSASSSGLAYATASRWLAGTTILGCGQSNGFWRCQLERAGKELTVVWRLSGEAAYAAPAGTTVMYRFGGGPAAVSAGAAVTVGALPVLFAPVEQSGLAG